MDKTLQALQGVTQLLVTANVAAPIVGATVMVIASIIRGLTGTGPSLQELADMIEAQTGKNDATIRAEIARLQAKLQ
jgi:hypothetical protein